jgi:hypothetical protein
MPIRNHLAKGFHFSGLYFGGNEKTNRNDLAVMSLDTMTMMFMVPKSLKKKRYHNQTESDIKFREEPAKTVAAISFGGGGLMMKKSFPYKHN